MSDDKSFNESLIQAYHNFAGNALTNQTFEKFGVKTLLSDKVKNICEHIENGERFQKILLIGHSGCGQSTILNNLACDKELNKQKHVIIFSLTDKLNLIDTDAVDILFVVYMQLICAAADAGFTPPFEKFQNLVSAIVDKFEINKKKFELFETIFFKLKTDSNFRKFLRENLKSKIDNLQTNIEEVCRKFSTQIYSYYKITQNVLTRLKNEEVSEKVLLALEEMKDEEYKSELKFIRNLKQKIGDVQTMHYKPVILDHSRFEGPMDPVIIIDDLDKLMRESVKKIFFEQSHLLAAPEAVIIFLFPLSAYYSPQFFHIKNYYITEFIHPVNLYDITGSFQDNYFNLLKNIILQRIDKKLISDDVLKYIIEHTGGLLRDLIHLMQDACKIAVSQKKDIIDKEAAEHAVNDMIEMYARFFDFNEYKDSIHKIMKTKNKTGMNHHQLIYLLKYNFVLEYGIQENPFWYDVHPCLKNLLNRKT